MDSVSTGHSKTGAPLDAWYNVRPTILTLWIVCSGVDHSPPGEYGQNIPFKELQGGFPTGPPILPPHLLQVILNKEVSLQVSPERHFTTGMFLRPSRLQCEPTMLPEPNHVMLNHLYALSIKVHSSLSFIACSSSAENMSLTVVKTNCFVVPGGKTSVARAGSNLSRCRLLSGRCHGAQLDASLPQEVRHDAAIQTHVMSPSRLCQPSHNSLDFRNTS